MIIWMLLLLSAFCETLYFDDKVIMPVIEEAKILKNHPLQRQTKQVLQQIYSNLDQKEIENMRKKLASLSEYKVDGKNYYELESEIKHEIIYFYMQAIQKIPGANVTTTMQEVKKSKSKTSFWNTTKEPLSITSNAKAKETKVHNISIEFSVDGKLYDISPSLLGPTRFYLKATDGNNLKQRKEECIKKIKTSCESYNQLLITDYPTSSRSQNSLKVKNQDLVFTVQPQFDPKTKNGDLSLTADKLEITAYSAAYASRDDKIHRQIYTNTRLYNYDYTEIQRRRIEEVNAEDFLIVSPIKSIPNNKATN